MIKLIKRLSKVVDQNTGKKYHLCEVESDILSYPEVKKHNILIDYENVDVNGKIINPLQYKLSL